MRRLIPAVLALAVCAGCARPRSADSGHVVHANPSEVALGPAAVPAPAAEDGPVPDALLRGMWERPVEGGRVRYSLDENQVIRIAVIDRNGKEAFYVVGQWSLGGTNMFLCRGTGAAFFADSRNVPELGGADVIRSRTHFEGAPLVGNWTTEFNAVGSFSFRVRPAGDALVIDRFEGANFTDRAKRLFEGRYVREAVAEAGS
jgi:hypothetical protein